MDVEDWARILLVVATASAGIVLLGALIGLRKSWIDWTMVVGAFLVTAGLGMTILAVYGQNRWLDQHGAIPCLGSTGMGALLFTLGFAMDQLRYRAILRYRDQLQVMHQAAEIRSMERSDPDA